MITIDKLQLYRNGVYFENKEAALAALEQEKVNAKDGEIMLARYVNGSVAEASADGGREVVTLIAVFAKDDIDTQMSVVDVKELHDGINGSLKSVKVNDIVATLYNDDGYLQASLVLAAKDIKTSADYSVIKYEQIGDTTFDAIAVDDSLEIALSKIESNVSKLVDNIVANELVIAKALTTLNDAAGLGTDGTYTVLKQDAILSAATTLYDADVELSSAIQYATAEFNDRVKALEEVPQLQSSETVKLVDVTDDDGNVIAKQFELAEELNLIVESDYELE